jgi:hypothetical protein
MKKLLSLLLAIGMIIFFSSIGSANDENPYTCTLLGRQIWPGISTVEGTVGAVFMGHIFDQDFNKKGFFSVRVDHDGNNIERCGFATTILYFKLVMYFYEKGRLALVMNQDSATAHWNWDDQAPCEDGCPFRGFMHYLAYLGPSGPEEGPLAPDSNCGIAGYPAVALIAGVSEIDLIEPPLGSYGLGDDFSEGVISGWLIHTPLFIPAVIATVKVW